MAVIFHYKKLVPATLIRRYKRFLVDVRMSDGKIVTAFTPNSGSMKTCSDPGSPVMLSFQPKPERKTDYTLEMVRSNGTWVGVHTLLANRLAERIINEELTGTDALKGFNVLQREFTYGDSRFDLLLSKGADRCLVEVKNVTLKDGKVARFPDAVTSRGRKHLLTLMDAVSSGYKACMLYIVQRTDCLIFGVARDIDPEYDLTLKKAIAHGVSVIACRMEVTPERIFYVDTLGQEKPL
ncbi:DNA/RNA nuclease SfsA [bacterium]|nr:MAG: DNA/RNA nuclease SfsA [bacterium]